MKNILLKISNIFKEEAEKVELESAALEDGTMIEADAFEEGQIVVVPVEDGEPVPLPMGEYMLDNGKTIAVNEEGVIIGIKDATEEEVVEEPMKEEVVEEEMADAPQAKKVIESQVKETVFSEVELSEKVEAAKVELQEQLKAKEEEVETLKADLANANTELTTANQEIETLKNKLEEEPAVKPLSRGPKTPEKAQSLSKKTSRHRNILNKIQSI